MFALTLSQLVAAGKPIRRQRRGSIAQRDGAKRPRRVFKQTASNPCASRVRTRTNGYCAPTHGSVFRRQARAGAVGCAGVEPRQTWPNGRRSNPFHTTNRHPLNRMKSIRMTTQPTQAQTAPAMMFASLPDPTPTHETRALIVAAAQGDPEEVARLLTAPGVDPEGVDHYGFSPLSAAALHGNAECVALLLPHCDARRELDGSTPLHDAALCGHTECVRLLLPHCDPSATIAPGLTPLMLAESGGHPDCIALLRAASAFQDDACAAIEVEITLSPASVPQPVVVAMAKADRQAAKRTRRAMP